MPHDNQNPFHARLTENRLLTKTGSQKEVRHLVVELAGSGLTYEPGDSLGVYPSNRIEDVEALLKILDATGSEPVLLPKTEAALPFREALSERLYILAEPPRKLLQLLFEKHPPGAGRERLAQLLDPSQPAAGAYLENRHVVDVLEDFPAAHLTPQELIGVCKRLNPRLYSIASSPLLHPREAHLTIAAVRYESFGKSRVGVGSTFSIDRVPLGEPILPVFVAASHFRLPASTASDLIMVGPGTGVAPFRAFLQHRQAQTATGRNWLFFGDQHRATDFLYEPDFIAWHQNGLLDRLSLAWSRDRPEKIYVQDLLRQSAADVWQWLAGGAAIYVCGDKERMARDVEQALLEIIAAEGRLSPEGASQWLRQARKDNRYQKDVY